MTWVYEQSTGKLYDPKGHEFAQGYSGGDGGKRPDGVNNPALQNVPCVGPLPVGVYHMQEAISSTRLGPLAIPLKPDPANTMFGRWGFFCHGDNSALNHSASDGCIIMPHPIREALADSPDKLLQVLP